MRATVEVDPTLLRDARVATGARDDAETVELALKAVVRIVTSSACWIISATPTST